MKNHFPTILGAGFFDTLNKFPNVKRSKPRKVQYFELELFSEDGGCSVINGVKHPIKKGNILIAKPNDIRYSHLPFKCHFLHFEDIPEPLIQRLSALPSFFEIEDYDKTYESLISIIKNYCSADTVDNLSASAKLFLLLKELCSTEIEENSLAIRAKRFINKNYSEELTVEDIAAHCNISASYLHKIYSKAFCIGPAEALLNRRIYKAKEMIISTDLSLSEISNNCGFNSQSYFSDCFKRKTGITPKEFRKNTSYI